MNRLKSLILLFCLIIGVNAAAQNMNDMRINEILVNNTADFQDDYGQHCSWIELFNTSYGTVDIAGCYLSNDRNNLTMYTIPKGDLQTKIKPRQHTLFFLDGIKERGTFHVNFTLAESDTIFFTSGDGRSVVDCIAVPKELDTLENVSFGRPFDGIGSFDGSGKDWQILPHSSASTINSGADDRSKSAIMKDKDPHGWILSVTSMSIVFLSLIILCLFFKMIGSISLRSRQTKSDVATEGSKSVSVADSSAESFAAIATALHLYKIESDAHDFESLQITLHHTDRTYSPWSSKIYTLRQTPQIKKTK